MAAVEVWAPGGLDSLAFASLNLYLRRLPAGWVVPRCGAEVPPWPPSAVG